MPGDGEQAGTSEEKLLTLAEWTVTGQPEGSVVETRNAYLPDGDMILSRSLDGPVCKGGGPQLRVQPPACQALCGHYGGLGSKVDVGLALGELVIKGQVVWRRPSHMGPGVLSCVGSSQGKTDARSRPGT